MGGNAIKDATRISKSQYEELSRSINQISTSHGRFNIIPSYNNKSDFGDMDILCETVEVRDHLIETLKPYEVIKNGPVRSLAILVDNKPFQVDLILSNTEDYEFSYCYFSFNDLGNLIGRIAHKVGFKFGHDGLHYVLRDVDDQSRVVDTLCLTKDFFHALEFLGYPDSYQTKLMFHNGFNNLEDIFHFVTTSAFFAKDLFPLEHRSHRARVRDAKRPTYTKFLKWIDENQPADNFDWAEIKFINDLYKKTFVFRAFAEFPKFEDDINRIYGKYEQDKVNQKKVTGKDIMEVLGVRESEEVGRLLDKFKDQYWKEIEELSREEVLVLLEGWKG